ncbi:MAG: transcription elongation factor GreA [Clostridiales bacterium]|jgi:transcription elongation factor GreA|nr:transcription elongation factor GreA [Clostridiales bacterium]
MAEDNKKIVLTGEGLKNLEDELENLKVVRRKEVAAKIKEARGQGDLSENAEYDAAKEEQAEIEARIITIEKMLRNAEVIDEEEISTGKVNIGNKVKLYDAEFEEEIEYTIVGSAEADPGLGKISNESPLGMALLGHSIGDNIDVEAPDGVLKFKILDIQ